MLYTGIDIIEIARIERAAQRWGARFLQRIYTIGELEDCGVVVGRQRPRYDSLAARWAAKEAAAKALGLGLRGLGAARDIREPFSPVVIQPSYVLLRSFRFIEIEVMRGQQGQPALHLRGAAGLAAESLGISSLALSLSHTRDYAVANVVAIADVPPVDEVG